MTYYSIKDLNKNEKPREKLITYGVSFLTDEELIALIIGSGGKNQSGIDLAREILKDVEGIGGLARITASGLTKYKNINTAKACAIKAAVELSLRIKAGLKTAKEISKPKDVYDLMYKHCYSQEKESLYLISLNSRKCVIATDVITIGTTNETIVHPRDIYKKAVERNAVYIILAHNHPSNDPSPSNEDIVITQRIAQIGNELGTPLLDHLIITNDGYYSLSSNGLIKQAKGGDINEQNAIQKF